MILRSGLLLPAVLMSFSMFVTMIRTNADQVCHVESVETAKLNTESVW